MQIHLTRLKTSQLSLHNICINYLIENYDYLNKFIDIYELWLNTEKDYKNTGRKDLKKRMSDFNKEFFLVD